VVLSQIAEEGLDPPSESSEKTDESARGDAENAALDPGLAIVIATWGLLSAGDKAAIIDITRQAIEAASKNLRG
jgi:hypothetical protein